MQPNVTKIFSEMLTRKILFVSGKGGVGKTTISQGIAHALANFPHKKSKKILWVCFENIRFPIGFSRFPPQYPTKNSELWILNCHAKACFDEYVLRKLKLPKVASIFVNNRLIQFLAKAAPGFSSLVLLGKLWWERINYSHIIVDLPSTGYGVAMFHSTENFSKLFRGGPIYQDTLAMMASFGDPSESGHLVISLPEEMPLRESLELEGMLGKIFKDNPAAYLLNKRFPRDGSESEPVIAEISPFVNSMESYIRLRIQREAKNLQLWEDRKIRYIEIPFFAAFNEPGEKNLIRQVSNYLIAFTKTNGPENEPEFN